MGTGEPKEFEGLEDTASMPPDSRPTTPEPEAHRRIGPYRLLHVIGEGGMGEVWVADQLEPVKRRVALKVIKAGMDTKQVIARFEAERQALAMMDHPAIAKVLDAGATAEGRPYFVMEYVPGVSLTEHCDQHRLPTEERLKLFMEVCEGVQHAHQKAVIHRDLKPSNILVSLVNGKAQPKIIDFGIAKATGQRLTEKTLFTEVGSVVGTPEYMSPEQADLTGQDIDTRTDIYSLGVILYQLLSGELPFASADLRSSSYEELRRKLREVDPPRPSTKVATLGDGALEAARKRETDPGSLRKQLQGDLDAIVMKALEKERNRRYGSASDLGADLQRFLEHEPVLARPSGSLYRMGKYLRRHRAGTGVALGLVLLLLGVMVMMTIQGRRIRYERDRANEQRDRANRGEAAAERLNQFMIGMFKLASPSESRGNAITVREVLDSATREIDASLTSDPELHAGLLTVMGNVHRNLGLPARARPLLERALEIQTKVLGPEHRSTLLTSRILALVLWELSLRKECGELARRTLTIAERVLGPEDRETLRSKILVANLEADVGRLKEAEALERAILEVQQRRFGKEDDDTLWTSLSLSNALAREARLSEAEQLQREIVEVQRRKHGPDHPETIRGMRFVAATLAREGRLAEAEAAFRDVVAAQQRVLGREHPETLLSMSFLARQISDQKRFGEAEHLEREVLGMQLRLLGAEHMDVLKTTTTLATTLFDEGRLVEAEELQRRVLTVELRNHPEDPSTALQRYNLACVLARQGKREEAISLLRQALDHSLSPQDALAIEKDGDLVSLRGDRRFQAIVADAKTRYDKAQ
jgi:serine/threonine protein kinase